MNATNTCYDGKTPEEIKECLSEALQKALNGNGKLKNIWRAVKSENDLSGLTHYYMAKCKFFKGCIGESIARDALDYITKNRDKKIHEKKY